jgi:hypothetical protein
MTADVVERLRAGNPLGAMGKDMHAGADEIVRQRGALESRNAIISSQNEAMRQASAEIQRLKDLIATSGGLQCPDPACNNQGWSPIQVRDDEWEQQQCEWCYTVEDSVFMRNQPKEETNANNQRD